MIVTCPSCPWQAKTEACDPVLTRMVSAPWHWSMRWLNLVINLYTGFNISASSPFKDTYAQSMNAWKEGPSDQSGMLDK